MCTSDPSISVLLHLTFYSSGQFDTSVHGRDRDTGLDQPQNIKFKLIVLNRSPDSLSIRSLKLSQFNRNVDFIIRTMGSVSDGILTSRKVYKYTISENTDMRLHQISAFSKCLNTDEHLTET